MNQSLENIVNVFLIHPVRHSEKSLSYVENGLKLFGSSLFALVEIYEHRQEVDWCLRVFITGSNLDEQDHSVNDI
jgi:hypothetical protein